MRKLLKRSVLLVVALVLALDMFAPKIYAGPNLNSITSDSIKEKEKQIKDSQNLKKQLQSSLSDAKAIKKKLEGTKNEIANYIQQLDSELSSIQDKIEGLNDQINQKKMEIEETTKELEIAIENEETQYQAMKDRIRFMYEQGDSFYLEIMFSAKTFADFLTKATYVDQLEAYDRQKLDEFKAVREWTELCKATLESEKEALDEAVKVQEAEQAAMEELISAKESELAKYNAEIKATSQEIAGYEASYAAEVATIEALEAAILEEKKAIAATMVTRTYDGGTFAWPCPGYIRVTEEFGWRNNPFSGKPEFHSGIDLGAPAGSPILAAYDGTVVAATYQWSMGNYVMIDHGDGLYTIYMHASKLYVSNGQTVSKGDTIAAVGTTGSSTGNHLHFSVRLNGNYVSPWNYVN